MTWPVHLAAQQGGTERINPSILAHKFVLEQTPFKRLQFYQFDASERFFFNG